MRKTVHMAWREYRAAVKTKGFLIGLIIAPVLMSGSILAFVLLKDRVDTTDRRIAVIDLPRPPGTMPMWFAIRKVVKKRNHGISSSTFPRILLKYEHSTIACRNGFAKESYMLFS